MKLLSSTEQDIQQLTEWIKADPYHKDCVDPFWWITGNGLLSYVIQDSKGPTMYVRTDVDGDFLRLHTQFAPESEVSKIRVMKSIIRTIPLMEKVARDNMLSGLVYKSTSPMLIEFMAAKFGFTPSRLDDYLLWFED